MSDWGGWHFKAFFYPNWSERTERGKEYTTSLIFLGQNNIYYIIMSGVLIKEQTPFFLPFPSGCIEEAASEKGNPKRCSCVCSRNSS